MPQHPSESSHVIVRRLRAADLDAVINLDARLTGRRREEYFRLKLKAALAETGLEVSLAAEIDSGFVGFLLAKVYYGEFGETEPVAVLDTLGVHPDFQKHGIGAALMDQLYTNLSGLGIRRLETIADWDNQPMLAFFQHEGFRPAPRWCLELPLTTDAGSRRAERHAAAR